MAETVVSRLKAELKRSLRSHVAQAVNDVCESFTEELKPQEPALSEIRPQVGASAFETDYDCCRRLVEYIERNMDTSPGFTQQMECIILACQSNAPVKVLNSVVKQNLWFRRKCVGDKGAAEQGASKKTADVHLNGGNQSATSHDEEKSVGEVDSKGGKPTHEKTTPPRVDTSRANERTDSKSTVESSDGGAVSLPREWGKRKRLVTRRRPKAAVAPSKRARRERPPLGQSSTESDTSQDERPNNQPAASVAREHNKTKAEPNALMKSNTDESNALAAVDPIATLCTLKARSSEQNKAFKTRLRDTIEIVDALLCKPPPGYSCARDCKSIRAQMCDEFTPCINPVCHAWHDAETHSESCPNEKCEFKTRVTLRETVHLIDQKQQEITSAADALRRAKADLLSPTRRSNQERVSVGNAETFKRIETLEHDLENLNGELLILLDTKLQQWATLSSIGIDTQSDKLDGVPDFASHYTTRSHQRKKP
ncbi:hypothetical protein PHYSODRAFT_552077 [Phytophthora sojae]|uniref:Uncharacterized protein n=1 Tax=Phytophthora sojae (strain P6497) TaxID=1094619 RepID=G4YFC6_PHYSP|nr:hypothetical protein PHYSODRAFT_552077 [Phytophthora sojae]EGZ28352.1 hypothetical protein PHYSODRAFT_552077 [Phytophthora sojae]|eukprot:XP_009515627.1 hypothetical protein PHYSODRAFT_552077 [Phytophthora sojae]